MDASGLLLPEAVETVVRDEFGVSGYTAREFLSVAQSCLRQGYCCRISVRFSNRAYRAYRAYKSYITGVANQLLRGINLPFNQELTLINLSTYQPIKLSIV